MTAMPTCSISLEGSGPRRTVWSRAELGVPSPRESMQQSHSCSPLTCMQPSGGSGARKEDLHQALVAVALTQKSHIPWESIFLITTSQVQLPETHQGPIKESSHSGKPKAMISHQVIIVFPVQMQFTNQVIALI